MLKLLASYDERVKLVLENAPQNAKYTSPAIQKEILQVFARKVQNSIRDEIANAKFCLIVDESRDEAKREQMAVVVRFVDKDGFVRERFLDLVHVKNTVASTLKEEILSVLSHHDLAIENIRGQGYDGASNMRGEWNGLQALILKECPYAYYVHCLAHQLQLALVAAAREVIDIHTFFEHLTFVVNLVGGSSKSNDLFQASQVFETNRLIELGEIETGKKVNQRGTLHRPGDTRWSSHFNSITSLRKRFNATCSTLQSIAVKGSTYSQSGNAAFALKMIMSFDFILILYVMEEILGTTESLCQSLQQKFQDIINAMDLVSTTKLLLQKLRDNGWKVLLEKVISFCDKHDVEVLDMSATFSDLIRSCRKKNPVTVDHHYHVEVFIAAIDHQLQELNNRFNEQATELLILSASLSPKDSYKSFKIDNTCNLVDKFYPTDFSDQEKIQLRFELQHYEIDVPHHPNLKNLATIGDLSRGLVQSGKPTIYPLVYRLLKLVLTLPVSTVTSERAFLVINIIKTSLRSSMKDEFLRDYLIVYIEKDIAEKFTSDMIINDFSLMKYRRVQLIR